VRYLLDVNALVALALLEHEFHGRVAEWARTLASEETPELATCSITELGLLRILAHAEPYGVGLSEARALLLQLKKSGAFQFTFISDDHDVSHIPSWVKTAKQTTDGHLVQLAKANGAVFASLDKRIPGAFFIPGG
jgi:uncharacterized protein